MDGTTAMLDFALKDGLFAALFVSLYFYQLKESRRAQDDAKGREDRLMGFMDELGTQFETLAKQYERISSDVHEIKGELKDVRAVQKRREGE